MKHFDFGRRHLLLASVGWVAGLAAVTAMRPAKAFTIEEAEPTSPAGIAFSQRCGPSSDHTALRAQLLQTLNSDHSRNFVSATCPLCGCPVVVSR